MSKWSDKFKALSRETKDIAIMAMAEQYLVVLQGDRIAAIKRNDEELSVIDKRIAFYSEVVRSENKQNADREDEEE